MHNIIDNQQEQRIPAILRLGFRPLFLSAGIWAVFAIIVWILALTGELAFSPYGHLLFWHGHEMIFGFACAVIVGFLLTAVQNWTGQMGLRGTKLALLWFLWLLPRVLLLTAPEFIPTILIAISDLLFLPAAAIFLALPIIKIKQYRNLFFVPVLLLLSVCNAITHLDVLLVNSGYFQQGSYAAIILISLIMTVMGGRVIAMFTANATGIKKREKLLWLERLSLVSVWLLAVGFLFNLQSKTGFSELIGGLFFIAALSNLARFARWRFFSTVRVPLLWSLQLAYLFIPLSFLLLAIHFALDKFALNSLLHGLTIGAMGNMILAMMARVSLGHSGRPLQVSVWMASAFAALALAAVVRLWGALMPELAYMLSLHISAGLWVYGFTVFSLVYFPVLTQPRVDGRPG